GTSNPGLIANAAAYRSAGPWLDEVLGYLDGNRLRLGELVAQRLPGVVYRPPEGTYLGWLDCTALAELGDRPGSFFADHAGVVFTEGEDCGDAGRGCVRLNLATPRPILDEIVNRMASALARR
ncbi:MAG: aminotransferase class I/II, partial [Geodermatophilaceae bacterium]|nr:aminotransferase class I/II [Geodermatophilaceae bacterium]